MVFLGCEVVFSCTGGNVLDTLMVKAMSTAGNVLVLFISKYFQANCPSSGKVLTSYYDSETKQNSILVRIITTIRFTVLQPSPLGNLLLRKYW